jgi:DNA-binding Lrp family transcriptional regulator
MKKKQIDLQDIVILNVLIKNAEISNKDLSRTLSLSEGPTLVRVQNLWKKGILKAFGAFINYQYFGFDKYYLIRLVILDTDADELKHRLYLNRYIILIAEIDGSTDLVQRIYIGVFLTKDLVTAKNEVKNLTQGLSGISSATLNPISFIAQKALSLDAKDIVK